MVEEVGNTLGQAYVINNADVADPEAAHLFSYV
jgi:hypothetical protein